MKKKVKILEKFMTELKASGYSERDREPDRQPDREMTKV